MRLGFTEIVIILAVFVLLFGGGKLAGLGKGLGEGIRNFKNSMKDSRDEPKNKKT